MARLTLAIGLGGLVATAFAQSTSREIVWSSVSFVLYGDRTPMYGPIDETLTPLGAQQLYNQGSMFRSRYLNASGPGDALTTTHNPINNLSHDHIDNSQLQIFSSTDQYTSASALAFTQRSLSANERRWHRLRLPWPMGL